ncbi:hypothetical protein AB8U03_15570 [Clostridium sp. Mt-5]|uniref:Uncharacterized protein n=1 Tax=Clostridium moutaii TaxID=3240932 RepID=A0ABV4BXM1_9CLOT
MDLSEMTIQEIRDWIKINEGNIKEYEEKITKIKKLNKKLRYAIDVKIATK